MNLRPVSLALFALFALAAPAAHAETAASDSAAVAAADRIMEALGGRQAWDALRGLRWSFSFVSNDTVRSLRNHAWDKHSGWHRVEGTNRRGQRYCTLHRLGESDGKAWVDGVAIEGDSLAKLVKFAQSAWTNDAYWFLMPYKLRDDGVTLKYEGTAEDGDRVYDKIAMSFEKVGETPGDRYWLYVNRANARIEKWEHLLQDSEPPPVAWTWEGWERHGGLWFPTVHHRDGRNVFTRDVETVSVFPPETFERP